MSPNQLNLLDPGLDFSAPPPSPIAAPRTTTVANDHVLSNFLYNTLRVPDLILPDHIFPNKLSSSLSNPSSEQEDIPVVDYQSLQESSSREVVMNSLLKIGCFQLINHGIESEEIQLAVKRGGEVFQLSPEKKKAVMKTMEMGCCGFEEVMMSSNGETKEQQQFDDEEFIWCNRDDELRLRMDQVWPVGYPRFRGEMESLSRAIENILRTILLSMRQGTAEGCTKTNDGGDSQQLYHYNDNGSSSVCYIYKNYIPPTAAAEVGQSSKSTMMMIRMMVKGSHYTDHALSLHVCGNGCTEFQVYSKKGWVSFVPCKENALIVTSGDQAQKWTGKPCKSVIGRSIYAQRQHHQHGNQFISMTFLYNPSVNVCSTRSASNSFGGSKLEEEDQKVVSLRQQALFAVLLTIACQLSLHIYYTFQNYFTG